MSSFFEEVFGDLSQEDLEACLPEAPPRTNKEDLIAWLDRQPGNDHTFASCPGHEACYWHQGLDNPILYKEG